MSTKRIVIASIVVVIIICGYVLIAFRENLNKKVAVGYTDKSIAVLPFIELNEKGGQEYLSDGLTEGILNSLAQLKGLKVTARTSSFRFKGKEFDVREAGKLLGVRTVLEGSVQRNGNRVRITAQLINAADGFHFWSEQYDENIDDIFAVQDKIARAIAHKLEITFLERELSGIRKMAFSKEAYELYSKGRTSWNLKTVPELIKGIEFFQNAIALEPSYAAAYAGVADCYTALGYLSAIAPREAFPKAYEATMKALELDSTLADAHATLAYYRFYYDWDWAMAEQEFRIAIAFNPNYELAYDWYGYYLTAMKRYDEAAVILKKAGELDPFSVLINTDKGFSLYYGGQHDLAIKELNTSIKMNPKYGPGYFWLSRAHLAKKMYPEAIAECEKSLAILPNWTVGLAQLGNIYGAAGRKEDAQRVLDTLHSMSSKKFVTSYGVAVVYAGMDDIDKSFLWLEKAYQEHSHWLVWLKTDPRLEHLRSDKRYAELVNRIGLPD